MFRILTLALLVIVFLPASVGAADFCTKAKFKGIATTYNPSLPGWKTGGQGVATGGTYNANSYDAALQLDIAKQYGCGYGSGKVCHAIVEGNGRAMIVKINDNGPMCADAATAARAADCTSRTARVIDLNEKSMRYLSNNRYGSNSGTIPNVTVTLLCNFNNTLGPIDEKDRQEWMNKIFDTPAGQVPTNTSPYISETGRPSIVGTPTGGAQASYYQPADFSNYQQSTPVSPTPYFSSTQPTSGTEPLGNSLTSTITRPQSAADFLLSVLQDPSKKGTTTSPFTMTIDGGNTKTLNSTLANRSSGTPGVLPVGASQTFVSPDLNANAPVSLQQGQYQSTIQSIIARFSTILATFTSLFSN